MEWLTNAFSKTPNNIGYYQCSLLSSELDGKTLLLKTPHTGVIEHGEISLEVTWKLHPYWLSFIALEGFSINRIKAFKLLLQHIM